MIDTLEARRSQVLPIVDGELRIERVDSDERWYRRFGDRTWTTTVSRCSGPAPVEEKIGPLRLHFAAATTGGVARLRLERLCVAGAGIPIRWLIGISVHISSPHRTTVQAHLLGGLGGQLTYVATIDAREPSPEQEDER